MSNLRGRWREHLILGGAIFLLLMVRSCAYGITYWPQLDDYIQFHNYAAQFTFAQLQQTVGVLASRPLAGLADYFLWTPMFGHMIVGIGLISTCYAAAVVLMKGLMERYFTIGPLFSVVMALLPLGVEGTYWMSASTRVVVGLLCACLAAAAFCWWLDEGGWGRATVFCVAMIMPFGFYEQSAVLAMTMVLGMAVLEWKKGRRALLSLWTIPGAGLYFALTNLLANGGVYANRAQLMLPNSDYYWSTFLPEILGQMESVFVQGSLFTLGKGLVRGLRQVLSGSLTPWFVVLLLASVLFGLVAYRLMAWDRRRRSPVALALLVGVLLTLAPLTPFLVLDNPWFSLRGAVTSFGGIALICDTLVMAVWRRLPFGHGCSAALAALTALVFCVAGASEIGDYRDTYLNDRQAAQAAIAAVALDFPTPDSAEEMRVGILGLEPSMLDNQNFYWHEHIHGCTESMWAFTGLMGYLSGGEALPSVTPLPSDPMYRKWNAQTNRPEQFDRLYYYDGRMVLPVTLEQSPQGLKVYGPEGVWLGLIWEEQDESGYFRRPEQLS